MMKDKQWYGYCNDGSQGQGCTDPQAEGVAAGGPTDVGTQNVTFGYCPLKSVGVRGLNGSFSGGRRWWIWGGLWVVGVWVMEF